MARQHKRYDKYTPNKPIKPKKEPEVEWTPGYIVGRWLSHTFIIFHLFLMLLLIAEMTRHKNKSAGRNTQEKVIRIRNAPQWTLEYIIRRWFLYFCLSINFILLPIFVGRMTVAISKRLAAQFK